MQANKHDRKIETSHYANASQLSAKINRVKWKMAGNTTHADTYRREALLTYRMWEEIYMARLFEKTNRKDKLNVEDN